jgi:hypothetical protein
VAAGSALLHLPLAGAGQGAGAHTLQVVAGLACLVCAVHLWRRPGPAAWTGHVAVAALMPVHGLLGGPWHDHAGTAATTPAATDPATWVPSALLLLAGLGVALGAVRWALGADVPLRAGPGPAQMPAAAGGSSGRRVPQA